jgi:NAD(P)-dependent dehydrogenase (short-subunit alcohol dehydrogenase family)
MSAGTAIYPSLALITGGASGIGEKIVDAFARQGGRTIFLDIQDEAAHRVIENNRAAGHSVPEYYRCDVTDIDELQACTERAIATHGTVDVLVNNAGNDDRHSIESVTAKSWDKTIAVNLKHQFFLTQAVLPAMKKARRGSIVNMSSISWIIPSTGLPVYIASKAAIVGLTRTLAHELGPDNIRVNAVLPGAIQTDRQQKLWFTEEYRAEILASQALKRMILPDDVANLVLFLAADDSSAITSQSYVVDGGWV